MLNLFFPFFLFLDTERRAPEETQNQPTGRDMAETSEQAARRVSDSEPSVNKKKETAATIICDNQDLMQSNSGIDSMSQEQWQNELINQANKPKVKSLQCCSVNQRGVLQTLGNYTFSAMFEKD